MSTIETAIKWMEDTARDNSHGYSQVHRWGPDYDCSSAVITAWESAGVHVKSKGAGYTGNMLGAFKKCGFKDITKDVDLKTGKGLQRGDVLLNTHHHTAMYCGNGKEVEASIDENGKVVGRLTGDQTGREFLIRRYRNFPWTNILRYEEPTAAAGVAKETKPAATSTKEVPGKVYKDNSAKKGKKYKVVCSSLNLRKTGNTNKDSLILTVLHRNDTAMWYGYYEVDSKGNRWLYVIANGQTGWACEKIGKSVYLKACSK